MRATILALAALMAFTAIAAPARAQAPAGVSSDAVSDFPNGLVFTLEASDGPFDDVRLVYKIAPDGVRASAIPDCSGASVVRCTFELAASRRNVIIPGAEVTYHWRITSGDSTQETDPQTVAYEDDRFEWRQISDGNLTLHWYSGSEEEAQGVLAASREALDGISALLQTTVDFPVKVRYYASASEMQPAIITDNAGGVVTLGEVVYSDTAMVSADSAPEEIARHEITHIVVREAIAGPYDVPDWLNEGTAVYAQSQPLGDQRAALENAIESGRVFSVRSLSSASSGSIGSRVSLFYGQSWSLVDFLVNTYGEEKFAQLFRSFKEGATTAEALEETYGFNQDGLENAWRESVGLPPRQAPTPDSGDQVPATDPAPTPRTEATSEADADDGAPVGLIVAIAVLTVLLAAALVGTGLLVARRYR